MLPRKIIHQTSNNDYQGLPRSIEEDYELNPSDVHPGFKARVKNWTQELYLTYQPTDYKKRQIQVKEFTNVAFVFHCPYS